MWIDRFWQLLLDSVDTEATRESVVGYRCYKKLHLRISKTSAAAVASFLAAVLTEIYLRNV
jgi:hypothetical protein